MDLNNMHFRENLSKVEFQFEDKNLLWGDYEKINSELFFSPQQSGKRNRIIMHVGGELMLIISIIMSAFNDYIKNMLDPSNNILAHLVEGDIVEIDGYRACYRGMFNNKVKLEYVDGTIYFPIDKSYKMTRYEGSAVTINKMPTKKGIKAKVTKSVLASVFDLDTKDFTNIIKYSTVFVAPKEKIYEILRNIKLCHENKKYEITSLFPFAYYSSADHQIDFAGNATKIEPIIKFTSRISVARDLIQDNKDIKNVVIIGEESFKNNRPELDWIFKRRSIENANVILEWGKATDIDGLLENTENLEVYAWTKNAILDRINLYENKNYTKNISNKSIMQEKLINNFINKEIEITCINDYDDFQRKLIETRIMLKEISTNIIEDDKKIDYLKLSYTLINLYEKSCFPLKILESMIEEQKIIAVHPMQTIKKLKELILYLGLNVFDSKTIEKAKIIVDNLVWLRKRLYDTNPKWDELLKLNRLVQFKKVVLILYKSYFIDVLKKCFSLNEIPIYFSINTVNKFNPDRIYDEVIIPGIYKSKRYDFLNNACAEKVKIFAYSGEKNFYEWLYKKNKYMINIIDKKNLMTSYSGDVEIDKMSVENEKDIEDTIEMEDMINDLIRKQETFEGNFSGNSSKIECIKMAIFENGEKAYFSRYFSPSLLDRDVAEVKDIKIDNLSVGDELVFKKDEGNLNNDIIQDIVGKLLENKDFNKQYKESLMLSHYWKNVLDKFMKRTGCNEDYISDELSNYNVVRGPMAVNTWLRSNKTTAPDREEVYYALAQITKDELFIDRWKDICNACAATRSLQMRLKRYLGRCIVKSVVNETKSDFDRIVESCVGDVSKLAQIVQVEELYDINTEIPVYMTNKLIDA